MSLFVALSGVTYAATALDKNSVKSKHIKDKAIKAQDVKDDALTGTQIDESSLAGIPLSGAAGGDLTGNYPNPTIANNAVNSAKIADNAVGTTEVAADSLAAGDLAPDSVNSSEIAANAVGSSEIAAGVVDSDELAQSHLHVGNSVNVNDPTALDGDWTLGAASTASCAATETILSGFLEFTTAGDEVATNEAIVDPATNDVVGRGISDNGGTQTYRAVAVCI